MKKTLMDWEPDSAYETRKVYGGLGAVSLEQMKEAMQRACDDQVKTLEEVARLTCEEDS